MNEGLSFEALLDRLQHGALGAPDAEWQAAMALGEMQSSPEKERAVTALLAVLSGGQAHALTRTHAVEALGRLGDRQTLPALLAALSDPYRLVRAYAAAALAELGDAQAIEPLLKLLESDDFFGVRAEAAAAVAVLGRQSDATRQQQVRAALLRQQAYEQAHPQPGAERVSAEIDRALQGLQA
jgi:HEAT repeat protein